MPRDLFENNPPRDLLSQEFKRQSQPIGKISGTIPAFLMGLLQYAGNIGKSEMESEPEIPGFLKPEKIRNAHIPEFSLKEHVSPHNELAFNLGEIAPDFAGLGYGAVKGLAKLTNKGVGKTILKDLSNKRGEFKQEYGQFFKNAEEKGIKNINNPITHNEYSDFKKIASSKYKSTIDDFIDNPSLKNAHDVQSMLGKFLDKNKDKTLLPSQRKAVNAAEKMQKNIREKMYKEMMKKGGMDLPFEYSDLTNRYRDVMSPYLKSKPIMKGEGGALKASRIPHELTLKGNDPILEEMMRRYPSLRANRFLAGPIPKYLGVGAGLYELGRHYGK